MASSYASYFDYGGSPTLQTERRVVMPFFNNMDPHDMRTFTKEAQTRQVASMQQDPQAAARAAEFEQIMRGHDANTAALTDKLRSIYDNYEGAVSEYGNDIQPIIDAVGGDIDSLKEWMGGYSQLLSEIKPGFMNGIEVENSPSARRAEYMGNVASQFGAAEDAMRRRMASQGMNPDANTGATRDFLLRRAGAVAGAANQAGSDFREAHNRDVTSQNAQRAAFAGLYGKQADNLNNIISARSGLAGLTKSVYDTRLEAQKAKAAGYEGLTGLAENRRSEALQLEQANARQRQANTNAMTTLQSGLGAAGKWRNNFGLFRE